MAQYYKAFYVLAKHIAKNCSAYVMTHNTESVLINSAIHIMDGYRKVLRLHQNKIHDDIYEILFDKRIDQVEKVNQVVDYILSDKYTFLEKEEIKS